jgi:murein L,D-transpeptidase YcbB/YkuD
VGARAPVEEQSELTELYEAGRGAPLWVDATGAPGRNARDALSLFEGAAAEGLDPADYASASLRRLAAALEHALPPRPLDVAAFDVAMSTATLRYFRHLHLGRIDPQTIGFRLVVPAEPHDFVALLLSALSEQQVTKTAAELAPPLVQYRVLRAMLARYRSLASDPRLEAPPSATSRRTRLFPRRTPRTTRHSLKA